MALGSLCIVAFPGDTMRAARKKQVFCLCDCEPQPREWLWPGRVAAGKLTLIDGDPSQGKSLLTLDLVARLTTARAMPDGPGPVQRYLIMSAEKLWEAVGLLDRFADTLRYRIWTELAEAEQIVEDRGELPEGAPSHEAVAGLCLSGTRQAIMELMNACDMAHDALGLAQPFQAYFQYVDAPPEIRRPIRRLLARREGAGHLGHVGEKNGAQSAASSSQTAD